MNLKKIGLYKRKCWAFQKEHRFTLTILPNIWGDIDINQMPKRIMQAVYDRIPPKLSNNVFAQHLSFQKMDYPHIILS